MNLPIAIAKRYLISKKSHNAINIITGIAITGVTIGTMALVIVLSAFNGISDLVQSLYFSFSPDVEITAAKGKTFIPNNSLIVDIKKINGVVTVTETVEGNALLKFEDKQTIVSVKGIALNYTETNRIDTLVKEGKYDISGNNFVLGAGIANVMDANVNNIFKPLSLYAPMRGHSNSLNPEDGLNELKMYPSGTFTINDEFDYKYVWMSISNARQLLDYTNEVSALELKLDGNNTVKAIAAIQKAVGPNYVVKSREQQNELLFKTLKSEKLWTFLIMLFILIVATFNVIGSLTMLIIEKKKDIQILSNIGASNKLIRKIFLTEGLLISLSGAILGLLLGYLICWLQIHFSLIKLKEGFVVDAFPIKFKWSDFVLILFTVLFIGFLAARYPIRFFAKKYLSA